MLGSGIPRSYGSYILSCLRVLHTAFHKGALIYIPTNSVEIIPFYYYYSSPVFVVVCVIDGSLFDWGEMAS
jgi:hypothetical protein